MFLASAPVARFRCPGERYDISPAIHRARLAAGYDKCRFCPHREGVADSAENSDGETVDHGASPADALQVPVRDGGIPAVSTEDISDCVTRAAQSTVFGLRERSGGSAGASPSRDAGVVGRHGFTGPVDRLFRRDGIRGVYLNEFDRRLAGEIAGAFASVLWKREPVLALAEVGSPSPLALPSDEFLAEGVTVLKAGAPGPLVVLAHDDRPCAADLAMGVGLALRRMGCQVVDLGFAVRPEFWFAVQHLRAAGGAHVTGSGMSPAYSGLDFVGRDAEPWSRGGDLDLVAEAWMAGFVRPSRRPGGLRSFRLGTLYQSQFRPLAHGLRPLRIAWACAPRPVSLSAMALLAETACRLIPVEIPCRERDPFDETDSDIARLRRAVLEHQTHLGFLVSDDGQQCVALDDQGRVIPPEQLESFLSAIVQPDEPCAIPHFCVETSTPAPPATLQQTWRRIADSQSSSTHGPIGYHWSDHSPPRCDALFTLLRLLQALSQSDATLSERLNTLELAAGIPASCS